MQQAVYLCNEAVSKKSTQLFYLRSLPVKYVIWFSGQTGDPEVRCSEPEVRCSVQLLAAHVHQGYIV